MRAIVRTTLRAWARTCRAPGYLYQVVDRWGGACATRPVSTRLPGGSSITCNLNDHVQRQIFFFGAYEPIDSYLFWLLLEPEMVVVDGGANVGQYSMLAAAKVGARGSVHAFEPIPDTFACLKKNLMANSLENITANNLALWNCEETVHLGMPEDMVDNVGSYTVGAADSSSGSIEASAASLDTYAVTHALRRLDLIKLDIEGAESFALRGARKVLEEFRPTILMEINRQALTRAGSGVDALWAEMSRLGYRIWQPGISAEDSKPIDSLISIVQQNLFFHYRDLPDSFYRDWNFRTALRWAHSAW
jgi:FkbM family methyltransferase